MSISEIQVTAAHRKATGLPYLVAAGVLWGTGGLTGKLLAQATGLLPLPVATYRLAVSAVLLLAFLLATGRRLPAGREAWLRITAIGLLAAMFQGSFFAAVALTSVSLATLVTIGTAPVLVLAVEWLTGRRRADLVGGVIVVLAVGGLTLLVGVPSGGLTGSAALAGAGCALAAAAGFATVTLISSRPVAGLDDLTSTGIAFAIGAAALTPLAAATGTLAFTPNPAALTWLVLLGTGPTALAYMFYFRGLRKASAGTAAVMALLEPLTAAILSALVLGDRLGPAGLTGAALLGGAILLAARTATTTAGPRLSCRSGRSHGPSQRR